MFPIVNGNGKRSLRGASGFTVVELVIVMSMMVIVVGIVAPRLRVSPTRRVQGMAHQMAGHLELARSRALGQRQLTRIVFDSTAQPQTYTAYVDHDRDTLVEEKPEEVDAFGEFGARELEMFVEFGRGGASTFPGDTSLYAVTLASTSTGLHALNLSVQGVPEPWGTTGTIYLVHEDDPSAVSAISVAASGSFKVWRWFQGAWQ